jgi:Na+/proline symporter
MMGGEVAMQDGGKRRETVLRWIARIWSVASVLTIVGFVIGEGIHPAQMTSNAWIGFVLFPFGICVGMILAWRREGLGGGLTLGCLAGFYLFHRATAGTFPRGWAWLVFAAPGIFFLGAWTLSRRTLSGRTLA